MQATPLLADETALAGAATGTQVIRTTEYEDYDEPQSKKAAVYVLVTLLILGLFGLLAWLLAGNLLGGAEPVEVPDVVGMQQDEAEEELAAVELQAVIETKNSKKPEGEVLSQDPRAGADALSGDEVTLIVSAGVKQVLVPDLVGRSLEEATALLKEARLKVGDVTEQEAPDAEPSEVLDQFPSAGEEVPVGREIDLVVAAASTVPDVVGETEENARAILEDAGYSVSVTTEPSDTVEEGLVIAQDPDSGAEYESGQTVTILVSEGPEAREMPDMTGRNADEAQAELEEDFGLEVTQAEGACASPPGTVCDQDPAPGTPVEPGDSATLYVQPGDAFIFNRGLFAWMLGLLA